MKCFLFDIKRGNDEKVDTVTFMFFFFSSIE